MVWCKSGPMPDYAVPTDDDEQWAMVERAMDEAGLTNEQRWWAFVSLDWSNRWSYRRVTGNFPRVFRVTNQSYQLPVTTPRGVVVVTGNRSNRQRVSELNDGSATSKQD